MFPPPPVTLTPLARLPPLRVPSPAVLPAGVGEEPTA